MNSLTKYNKNALQWAIQYLASNNIESINHKRVFETAYSTVYFIETNKGNYYLKEVPESLFLESKLLSYSNQKGCKNIPKILADNN